MFINAKDVSGKIVSPEKPLAVLKAMDDYYARDNSNVHRGVHQLAARATASATASSPTQSSAAIRRM